jgi:ABC-type spermidine/putrescine transport system permease subunit II
MHISAQSIQSGQQLKGFPSLMQSDTQFSQAAAHSIKISMVGDTFSVIVDQFSAILMQ